MRSFKETSDHIFIIYYTWKYTNKKNTISFTITLLAIL